MTARSASIMTLVAFLTILAAIATNAAPASYPGPYEARAVKVVDADTLRVRVKVWPTVEILATVRLRGVDTPELGGHAKCQQERLLAKMVTSYVRGLIKPGARMRLRNIRLGKYAGRVIANVEIAGVAGHWSNLADLLIAGGYGRPYNGGRRNGWCDQ